MKKSFIIILALVFFTRVFAQVEYPGTVNILGSEEIVFDYSVDSCYTEDIPDAPARAFRDADGKIQLIASHTKSYRMIGDDFNSLVQDCSNGPVFASGEESGPENYNNNEWIRGIYTKDGKTIYATIHNEYLPLGGAAYDTDWFNSLTYAVSSDSGRSYNQAASPNHFMATIPYQYESGVPMGIFGGSNIIYNENDGYYYKMVHLEAYKLQDWGAGVIRTQTIEDPRSWRGWDGSGYNVAFVDPYNETVDDPANHILEPVSRDNIGKMSDGLVYSTYFQKYMVIGFHNKYDASRGEKVYGIYYSVSEDLIHWSAANLILESDTEGWETGAIYYPTVIDHADTSRNFERIGQTAYVYFTKWNAGLDRDLIRVPIQFNKNIVSSFTVNSTGDDEGKNIGDGTAHTKNVNTAGDPEVTLRSAMLEVINSPDPDYTLTINFDIPGDGPHIISVGSFLPEMNRPVIIDGYSQPGSSPNSASFGEVNNADLRIEIDGSNSGGAIGIYLQAGNSTVKGLVIHSFGNAIEIENEGSNTITGCFLGVDASGIAHGDGNGIGINSTGSNTIGGVTGELMNVISGNVIISGSGASNNLVQGNYIGIDNGGVNVIGPGTVTLKNGAGSNIVDGNLISGTYNGIEILDLTTTNNIIKNNLLGTDLSGLTVLNAGLIGIYIADGANHNTIGSPDNPNVIGGWGNGGIIIEGSDYNTFQSNFIGIAKDSLTAIGNLEQGIYIFGNASNNLFGGTETGEGNIISANAGAGISLAGDAGSGNGILGNSIYSNGYAIDLNPYGFNNNDALDADSGPNDLQNNPLISSVTINTGETVIGADFVSEANTTYRIEYFESAQIDVYGLGQGEVFVYTEDVTTDANGEATISTTLDHELTPGYFLTATATDPSNNTSEFSNAVQMFGDAYYPDINVVNTLSFTGTPGTLHQESILIENTGTLPLDWVVAKDAMWISLDTNGGRINAGENYTLNVEFDPSGLPAGENYGVISFTSNDPDEGYLELAVTMTVNGVADMAVSPLSLELGLATNATVTDTVFVSNTGSTQLDCYFHTSQSWIISDPTWAPIQAGETDTILITVNSNGLASGDYSEWFRIDHNIPDSNSVYVTLNITVSVEGPALTLSPDSLDASMEINSMESYVITLENPGSETLNWSAALSEPWASLSSASGSIATLGTEILTLDLNTVALDEGIYRDTIIFTSNDPNHPVLSFPITLDVFPPGGDIVLSQGEFDFTISGSHTRSDSLFIRNAGSLELSWNASESATWLSLSSLSGTLQENEVDTLVLSVNSQGLDGEYNASILINSNDPYESSISVPVHLTVNNDPDIRVNPDSLVVYLESGQSGNTSFYIVNDGGSNLNISHIGVLFSSNWLYIISSNPGTIASGDSVLIDVGINGTNPGLEDGENWGLCFIESDDSDTPVAEVIIMTIIGDIVSDVSISPDNFDFVLFEGDSTIDSLRIENTGSEQLNWAIASTVPWLSFQTLSGSLSANQSDYIYFKVNSGMMLAGVYSEKFTVAFDDMMTTTFDVTVSLTVESEFPMPLLTIVSPVENEIIYSPEIELGFLVENFNIAAPPGTDGYLQYQLDDEDAVNIYTLEPVMVDVPTDGSHTLILSLVDPDGLLLQPEIKDTVHFEVLVPKALISVSTDSLGYEVTEGETALDSLWIINSGDAVLDWKISASETWLTVLETQGAIDMDDSSLVHISIDVTNLVSGDYVDTLKIISNDPYDFLLTIPVNLKVTPFTFINNFSTLPGELTLLANYPNPFNPTTVIPYGVSETSDIMISIYDIRGRKVISWNMSQVNPGWYELLWDGKNTEGHIVSNGMYIYQIGNQVSKQSKKMVFIK